MNSFFRILRKIVTFIVVIALLLSIAYIVYSVFFQGVDIMNLFGKKPTPPPQPKPAVETKIELHKETEKPTIHIQKFAPGSFGPDEERMKYKSGSMTLSIPRLDYEGPVLSVDLEGKTAEYKAQGYTQEQIDYQLMVDMDTVLNDGIALFNQAQLPGPENRNVSIAGHRDFKGMEFYYIDTITEGDLISLFYEDKEYVYLYDRTFITHDADWRPIEVSDKSQITLQSCDPIFAPNAEYDRIFVVAYLVDIIDPNLDLTAYGPFLNGEVPLKSNKPSSSSSNSAKSSTETVGK